MLCFIGVSSIKPVTVWLGADRDEAHFLTREVGDKNSETSMVSPVCCQDVFFCPMHLEERFVWCRFQPVITFLYILHIPPMSLAPGSKHMPPRKEEVQEIPGVRRFGCGCGAHGERIE